MAVPDHRFVFVCLVMAVAGLSEVDTATLTASIDPSPAVKGATRGHTVRCDFSFATGDRFQAMNLYLTGGPTDQGIATIYSGGPPLWDNNAPRDQQQRGTLGGSESQGFLTLAINDTQCSDLGQSYKCDLRWATATAQSRFKTATVALEAPPKAPEVMEVSPNSDNVTEFTEMTFTCRGNVGRPAGTFQWFTIADTTVDVTDQATQGNALAETAPGETCTFRRTSVLTLNVTRIGQGKRLVVRCRVNHPTQGNSNPEACQDPNVDYCRMSQQFDIQYPVRVGVSSDAVMGEEGKDISITCTTQGNPLPYRIEWHREGDETSTLSTENGLTLRRLTLSDTGNYICTAYNLVEGSTRQDSVTVLVTVEKTTTPTPTTSSTSTAQTSTSVDNACTFKPESGHGVAAVCTTDEVKMLLACIKPHNSQFLHAFRGSSKVCNRSLISSDLCQSFSQIVTCTNSKPVSDVTCRPSAVAQINYKLKIPCKIKDFVAVCTDAPRINQGNNNGSRREVVTLPLLMTSLMATFVVTVLSIGGT